MRCPGKRVATLLALVLCAACGRFGYDQIPERGDGNPDTVIDTVIDTAPCGPFMTVKATYAFPATTSYLTDSNRFAFTQGTAYVLATTDGAARLYYLDHDLVQRSAPTLFTPSGNAQVLHDPVDNVLYGANIANGSPMVTVHDLAGTLTGGPITLSGRTARHHRSLSLASAQVFATRARLHSAT